MALNDRPVKFITGQVFHKAAFGSFHPLSIARHGVVVELCDQMGWLGNGDIAECPQADRATLERFHDPGYLDALARVDRTQKATREDREKFNLGSLECPVFEGLWNRAASTVGGSVLAARLALAGEVAFHPAGGTHHGLSDRASGFCYFNDPVFAVLTLLDAGIGRVAYVDLDAHHGDGVQDAFADDSRVLTMSIHEENRWPFSGEVSDRSGGTAVNLPVPVRFNDKELAYLMDNVILPNVKHYRAEAIVITCGAAGLDGDPLSRLGLSNVALWRAVEQLVSVTPHAVVLGGGGYNPWTVARCWAGLWARLSSQDIPDALPAGARQLLESLECDLVDEEDVEPCWLTTISDKPNDGPVRPELGSLVQTVTERADAPS